MADFFSYITSKVFLKHAIIAILSLVILLWCLFKFLNTYTNHGETAIVPDFKGKHITELDAFVADKNVSYVIIDSLYSPEEKPGSVIKQDPEPKSEVKHNRIIYLYVTSTQPPQIIMPKLVDRSTRQAIYMIESYGLKLGRVDEITADCKGCVLKQQYKGRDITAGTAIKKGSKIDITIGKTQYQSVTADSLATEPTVAELN